MMRGPVVAHKPGPIHSENHMKIQHGHILKNLVVGSLEKGGINRHHRDHALLGKAACHGDRVLLRNAHIKQPLRETAHEAQQTGTAGHGCCNGANPGILLSQLHHGFSKRIGVSLHLVPQLLTGCRVKLADPVELGRILLRKAVASSLLGHHMNQHRLPELLCSVQQRDQAGQIMAIHRPQVGKAHILKNRPGQQKALQAILCAAGDAVDCFASGQFFDKVPVSTLGIQIV